MTSQTAGTSISALSEIVSHYKPARLISVEFTKTLDITYGLLVSAIELSRGASKCLDHKLVKSFAVIRRAVMESVVDLRYLALKDDNALNVQFLRYPILVKRWSVKDFTTKLASVDTIAANYVHYVERMYRVDYEAWKQGELTKAQHASDPETKQRYLKKSDRSIDEFVKDRYQKHWSGLNFTDRLRVAMKDIPSANAKMFRSGYRLSSLHLHSSAYLLPGFDANLGTWDIEWTPNEGVIVQEELFIFLALDLATRSHSMLIPVEVKSQFLSEYFRSLFIKEFIRRGLAA